MDLSKYGPARKKNMGPPEKKIWDHPKKNMGPPEKKIWDRPKKKYAIFFFQAFSYFLFGRYIFFWVLCHELPKISV